MSFRKYTEYKESEVEWLGEVTRALGGEEGQAYFVEKKKVL